MATHAAEYRRLDALGQESTLGEKKIASLESVEVA